MIDVIGHAISGTQERELSLAELSVGGPQSGGGRATGSGITSLAGITSGKTARCTAKRHRTGRADRHKHIETAHKNLAPLPRPPAIKPITGKDGGKSITVDPESPESFMKLPKRHRWVKEKYTRWVKTQPW